MASTEERLAALEQDLEALKRRVHRLEGEPASAPSPPPVLAGVAARPVARPKAADPVERPAAKPLRPEPPAQPWWTRPVDVEELLGGRVLALVGGIAVLLGLVFLVALAIERGWLDERPRVALAFAGSVGLVAAGAWLYERRGRTQAALAIVGTGIAGLFLSLTAATVLYDLIPVWLTLAGAFVFGALGTALAIRWDATPIGGLGILGALAAPVLVGATHDATSLFFLAAAHTAAVGVLVWRRWEWLRVAAVALVLIQLASWVVDAEPGRALGFAVLALFGLLNLAAALGFEVRRDDHRPARSTFATVVGSGATIGFLGAFVGWGGWESDGSTAGAGWWLAGVAVVHAALGLGLLRARPLAREAALTVFAVGLVAANVAFVVLVDGVAIPIGWAAAAAALALPARALTRRVDAVYAVVGAQLALAVGHVLMYDAPLEAVAENEPASVWPVLAIAASAFVVARLTPREEEGWQGVNDATALAALAYAAAVVVGGVWLVGAWVLLAAVALEAGRRFDNRVAAVSAIGLLVLAALHVLAYEAPPDSLVDGAPSYWRAALALGAIAVAAVLAARRGLRLAHIDRPALEIGAGVALVYLASVGIVSAFQPGVFDALAGELTVREQGQALLSVFWGLLGLALLWAGLRRDERPWRLAGFALLAVAVGKVFLYDMAALNAGYRVLSFIVLGLLLLAGAYAYQRMRRRPGGPATV